MPRGPLQPARVRRPRQSRGKYGFKRRTPLRSELRLAVMIGQCREQSGIRLGE